MRNLNVDVLFQERLARMGKRSSPRRKIKGGTPIGTIIDMEIKKIWSFRNLLEKEWAEAPQEKADLLDLMVRKADLKIEIHLFENFRPKSDLYNLNICNGWEVVDFEESEDDGEDGEEKTPQNSGDKKYGADILASIPFGPESRQN